MRANIPFYLVAFFLLLSFSSANAQSSFNTENRYQEIPNSRIKINIVRKNKPALKGDFTAIDDSTITIRTYNRRLDILNRPQDVEVSEISYVVIKKRKKKTASIIIGALIGGVIGGITSMESSSSGILDDTFIAAIPGILIGAPIGGLIGSAIGNFGVTIPLNRPDHKDKMFQLKELSKQL